MLLSRALGAGAAPAQGRLNEIVAATNDRLTMADDQGRVRPGSGVFWADPGFSAPGWLTGNAPLGFAGAAGLGTNVATLMQNRTSNLYLRRVLNLSTAQVANEGQLQLKVRFDDAFIAYLNGREVARSNAGPVGHYIYADQKAYNFAASTTNTAYSPPTQTGTVPAAPGTGITYPLGRVSDFLQAGDNLLAIQLINREPGTSARIDAQLEVVTANVVLDLARYNFNDANNSAEVHRNLAGSVTDTTEGTIPANSWLDLAAPAQSGPGWEDLSLRSSLLAGVGYEGTGALRYTYSQTDPANWAASVSGPALPLGSQMAPGALTVANLSDLRLAFRFRATANTAYNIRLDPTGNSPADSLTGLAALTPTGGTGITQDPVDDFGDSAGAKRTRTISGTGSATTTTTGTLKNSLALLSGPAMRTAVLSVTEDNATGSGTNSSAGALQFEVVSAPVTPDFFGFTYQSVVVRTWTATAVTAAQLKTGAIQFDYNLPAGVSYTVFLESASGSPTASDRLGLGTITGNGAWNTATLDTGTGTNQAAFINYLNSVSTNSVKVGFLCSDSLPTGSRMLVDNVGYNPWRTYNVALSTGANQTAFLAALNAQASPQFYPVFEKTGNATAPANASVTIDDFALTLTKTNAGSAVTHIPYAAPAWRYYPGLAEPSGGVIEPADFNLPLSTPKFADWIEILNPGATPVNLANWSLSDSSANPTKFIFPAGTTLNPGAALIVIADNRVAPAGASYLHAMFNLASDGEFVGLYNPEGNLIDALNPGYPQQNSFYSWGRDPVTAAWGYLRTATPGQQNVGSAQSAQAAPPVFSVAGGFYVTTVSLALTTPTPGAVIRYTTDGTEPRPGNGLVYGSPLTLAFISDRIGHVIKARTFGTGQLPSDSVVNTYLINQHAGIRTAPAVMLSGDPGTTFYKPLGILAIQGGIYNTGVWAAALPTDYNIPVGDGRLTDPDANSRPYERPSFLEYYYPDNRAGLREAIGVRVSSSPYSRPRLVLTDSPSRTLWDANETLKPSFNIFFRNDYGHASINHPLIPETEVREFSEFRLRAGKNDISNPFIRDEFIRRIWTDMGQEGTVGTFTSLYLNGYFKGYYNLVERIREAFMQTHHRSTAEWDVNYIGTFENGDSTHWDTVLQPRLNANLTVKANWDALRQILDIENVADYILLNTYSAMWDWPHNNWAMARERSATGRWRCYVWDAEGGFNMGGKGPTYQTLRDDLLATAGANNTPVPVMFRRLMTSPEFRLLFADRIQRHLFNKGAITDARMTVRRTATQAEVTPLMAIAGITPDTTWFTNWLNPTAGRRATLFPNGTVHGQFRDPNQDGVITNDTLWPLTLPPAFSQHGGTITTGFNLTISHTAPAGSIVYYTTNGTDPREWGGAPAASALTYTAPIAPAGSSVMVKTRVRNAATNEWSPLTEARFAQATVPASTANTVIAEVMYNPPSLTTAESTAGFPDAQDFEYIVLQNIGPAPVDLTSLRFQLGITFNFDIAARPVLDPGQRTIIAKNASALRFRYGTAVDPLLGGEYFGNLSSSGELVRLEITAGAVPIKAFTYSDLPPWPIAADGNGSALLLLNPASNPDHNLSASWTATAGLGGTPTGVPLNLTYAQWAAWAFSAAQQADPSRSGPTADLDGDGIPNLIEFLAGTDHRNSEIPPPFTIEVLPGTGGSQLLRMTFPRLSSSIGYTLAAQSSSDLADWQSDFTLTASAPLPNGTTMQTWEKTASAGTLKHYMRLKAIPVP